MKILWIHLLFLKFLFSYGKSLKFLEEQSEVDLGKLVQINPLITSVMFGLGLNSEITINVFDKIFASNVKNVNVRFNDSVISDIFHVSNCNLSETNEIYCNLTDVKSLPSGTYKIELEITKGNFKETPLYLVSVQVASETNQAIFESIEGDNQCLSSDSGNISIKFSNSSQNLKNATNISAFFIGKNINNHFNSTCNGSDTTILTCTYNDKYITTIGSGNYTLYNIFYYKNETKFASFINDRKKTFELTKNYYNILGVSQEIALTDENNVISLNITGNIEQITSEILKEILAFKETGVNSEYKSLPDTTVITVKEQEQVKVVEIKIDKDNEVLKEGKYDLYFKNGCERYEKSSITISIGFVVNIKDINNCITELNSFTISTSTAINENIVAELRKNDVLNYYISYSCTLISGSTLERLCKTASQRTIPSGKYNFTIYYLNEKKEKVELYIPKNQRTVNIEPNNLELESTSEQETHYIDYNANKTFTLTFTGTFSTKATINITLEEDKTGSPKIVKKLNCMTASGSGSLTCPVKDPTYLPSGKTFTLKSYENLCGEKDFGQNSKNIKIKTRKMILGPVNFKIDDQKCTSEIHNFTINIQNYIVEASDFSGKLKNEKDQAIEIDFNCEQITKESQSISCFLPKQPQKEGDYYVASLSYTPSGDFDDKNKESETETDFDGIVFAKFHNDFKPLGSNNENFKIIEEGDFYIDYSLEAPTNPSNIDLSEKNSGLNFILEGKREASGKKVIYNVNNTIPHGTYNISIEDACGTKTTLSNYVTITGPEDKVNLYLNPTFDSSLCYDETSLSLTFDFINKTNNEFSNFIFTFQNDKDNKESNLNCKKIDSLSSIINMTISCDTSSSGTPMVKGRYYLTKAVKDKTDTDTDTDMTVELSKISELSYTTEKDIKPSIPTNEQLIKSDSFYVSFSGNIEISLLDTFFYYKEKVGRKNFKCLENKAEDKSQGDYICSYSEGKLEDGSYKIYYEDFCGIEREFITLIWKDTNSGGSGEVIYYNTSLLPDYSCTSEIPRFTVPITSDENIGDSSFTAEWKNDEGSLEYKCEAENKEVKETNITCTPTSKNPNNGKYTLSKIKKTKDKASASVDLIGVGESKIINYNKYYISLQKSKSDIQYINDEKKNFSLTFTSQLTDKEDYKIKTTQENDTLIYVELNCKRVNAYSTQATCTIPDNDYNKFIEGVPHNVTFINVCGEQEETKIKVVKGKPNYTIPGISSSNSNLVGQFDLSSSRISFKLFSLLMISYLVFVF